MLAVLVASCSDDETPGRDLVASSSAPAAQACASVARVEQLVDRNASAKDVLSALDEAGRASHAARDADPRWVQLASGIELLDEAIRSDRGDGIALALSLIDSQCGQATPSTKP